jgi:predicted membrane protein
VKRLGRIISAIVVVQIGMWVAARVAQRLSAQDTDPTSEDFALVTYVGGKAYSNRAANLRSGSAVTMLGGSSINLTGAGLDPGGATLLLKTRFGGVKVRVPGDWHVDMMGEASTGDNSLNVTDPSTLPEDAPRLSVVADTKFGGVLVTT